MDEEERAKKKAEEAMRQLLSSKEPVQATEDDSDASDVPQMGEDSSSQNSSDELGDLEARHSHKQASGVQHPVTPVKGKSGGLPEASPRSSLAEQQRNLAQERKMLRDNKKHKREQTSSETTMSAPSEDLEEEDSKKAPTDTPEEPTCSAEASSPSQRHAQRKMKPRVAACSQLDEEEKKLRERVAKKASTKGMPGLPSRAGMSKEDDGKKVREEAASPSRRPSEILDGLLEDLSTPKKADASPHRKKGSNTSAREKLKNCRESAGAFFKSPKSRFNFADAERARRAAAEEMNAEADALLSRKKRGPMVVVPSAEDQARWGDFEKKVATLSADVSLCAADIPFPTARDANDAFAEGIDTKALKLLIVRWHPDKFNQKFGSKLSSSDREEVQEKINEVFQMVQTAKGLQKQ